MKSTEILPLRHQAKIRNRWLKERLETILPAVMAVKVSTCGL
jgi:hypothetical protein